MRGPALIRSIARLKSQRRLASLRGRQASASWLSRLRVVHQRQRHRADRYGNDSGGDGGGELVLDGPGLGNGVGDVADYVASGIVECDASRARGTTGRGHQEDGECHAAGHIGVDLRRDFLWLYNESADRVGSEIIGHRQWLRSGHSAGDRHGAGVTGDEQSLSVRESAPEDQGGSYYQQLHWNVDELVARSGPAGDCVSDNFST